MVRIIFAILLCAGATALAHQDGAVVETDQLDCEHPPEGAITELPGLLGVTGRIVCMPGGQTIIASETWSWRYTGSFFNMPNVPAFAHADSQGKGPPYFFRDVGVEKLSAEEASKRSAELEQQLVTYRPETSLAEMSIVKAENNHGDVTRIFMAMESEKNGWAIVCTPECQPDYVILINKLEPN